MKFEGTLEEENPKEYTSGLVVVVEGMSENDPKLNEGKEVGEAKELEGAGVGAVENEAIPNEKVGGEVVEGVTVNAELAAVVGRETETRPFYIGEDREGILRNWRSALRPKIS